MSDIKMHEHEIEIDAPLIQQLLDEQFPQWAQLPIKPIQSIGTDNAIYQLGVDMCVRLPRLPDVAQSIETEQKWLPHFSTTLSLGIPALIGKGTPNENYPLHWSIYRWLEGENAFVVPIVDLHQAASDLAQFLTTLQKISPAGGPPSRRGVPLLMQDDETRAAIESLRGIIDTKVITALWEECLKAPAWDKPPVWTHGDLLPANLLVNDGQLSAVIDFGMMGVGDPACDLIVAWSVLSSNTRDVFRTALAVDDATWMRGRGWALSIALIILPYYHSTNPGLVAVANRMINEIIADS